jgi:hypothetical protein
MNEAASLPQVTPSTDSPAKERERSTIDFPYNSLNDAIGVAKAVHKLGGNQCRLDSLAAELGHETSNSGGFRQKLASAHNFGLTSLSQGIVSLTALGGQIVDPEQDKVARVKAFLQVPLYAAIYNEFKDGALPPPSGLEAKMASLGVASKQKDKARQVFHRSAKEAGFFAYGSTRLVYPALGNAIPPKQKETDHEDEFEKKGGNGNGGGGGKELDPLIQGLLNTLPEPKSEWPIEGRRKWLQLALSVFDMIYRGADDASIVVKIDKDSAK